MSGSVQEKVSEDLRKAREEGGLRAERIKTIVKAAVSQAIAELKEGSGEISAIARDAITAASEEAKGKSQEAADNLRASIEGAVEGISEKRRMAIAQNQAKIQTLEAEVVEQERLLQNDIEGALMEIETSGEPQSEADLKSVLDTVMASIRDSEAVAAMQEQYARLRAKLAVLDANLAGRYGDRYDEVKQHLDSAKKWYENTKTNTEAGSPNGVQQKHAEFEQKLGELGTALAHKEKQIKEQLKELWQTTTHW
jgi:uncharacterized protein YjbJ (UPF0337 family)